MRRRLGPVLCALAVGTVVGGVVPGGLTPTASADTTPACVGATITTTSGSSTATETIERGGAPPADAPDGSCWVEAQPYPFGAEGEAVSGSCASDLTGANPFNCYLTVTSLAFRGWNRGIAATTETPPEAPNHETNPYGVWVFNGDHWYPSPGFPGSKECPGHTVLWAGKLDYWLIDADPSQAWGHLCRFDGELDVWESLPIPPATLARIEQANGAAKPGTITSGACFAWNDCWFLGTYGTVVHWNGEGLSDASPPRFERVLQGEYTAAVSHQGPLGEPIVGLATAATSESVGSSPLVESEGSPPQLFASGGEPFSPLPFAPPTIEEPGDPFRTDLVAVDVNSSGLGWAAGNPAGVRLEEHEGSNQGQTSSSRASEGSLAPIVPVSTSGGSTSCIGPPPKRFTYAPPADPTAEVFLWSSIAVIADGEAAGAALAAGRWHRDEAGATETTVEHSGEPVIARANCAGVTSVTRFVNGHEPPADRDGGATAIAANASNDAWATTSRGAGDVVPPATAEEPPRLYRLTNGGAIEAPEANDNEPPHQEPKEDEPRILIEPPAPEPPPEPPAVVPTTRSITLPAAVYDVKAKVHEVKRHGHVYLYLYVTFRLRRPVRIGAQALRRGHVVSAAKPRLFAGHTGLLILSLNRKHWPTKVNFVS